MKPNPSNLAARLAALIVLMSAALLPTTEPRAGEAPALATADIFAIYDQVNGFDIETASLGAVRGRSPALRELAVMVLRDHSAVREIGRGIAKAAGVSYRVRTDNDAQAAHTTALAGLVAAKNDAFDATYLAHEVKFHRDAIQAVRKVLIPAATLPELKAHLTAVLPAFEHHLAATLAVADKLGLSLK